MLPAAMAWLGPLLQAQPSCTKPSTLTALPPASALHPPLPLPRAGAGGRAAVGPVPRDCGGGAASGGAAVAARAAAGQVLRVGGLGRGAQPALALRPHPHRAPHVRPPLHCRAGDWPVHAPASFTMSLAQPACCKSQGTQLTDAAAHLQEQGASATDGSRGAPVTCVQLPLSKWRRGEAAWIVEECSRRHKYAWRRMKEYTWRGGWKGGNGSAACLCLFSSSCRTAWPKLTQKIPKARCRL